MLKVVTLEEITGVLNEKVYSCLCSVVEVLPASLGRYMNLFGRLRGFRCKDGSFLPDVASGEIYETKATAR